MSNRESEIRTRAKQEVKEHRKRSAPRSTQQVEFTSFFHGDLNGWTPGPVQLQLYRMVSRCYRKGFHPTIGNEPDRRTIDEDPVLPQQVPTSRLASHDNRGVLAGHWIIIS